VERLRCWKIKTAYKTGAYVSLRRIALATAEAYDSAVKFSLCMGLRMKRMDTASASKVMTF
jgi:hypothetical protein